MTAGPPPAHHVHTVRQGGQEARNFLRGILQVGVERQDDVSFRPLHPGENRGVLPVVAVEPDHLHRWVLRSECAQDVRRSVAAPVVDEDDLVGLAELLEGQRQAMVEVAEAPRLVEDGDHDRQHGARPVAQGAISRTSKQSLCPPNPNEFEMAARMRPATGVLGT